MNQASVSSELSYSICLESDTFTSYVRGDPFCEYADGLYISKN